MPSATTDIRSLQQGGTVFRPTSSPHHPIHTYGGDTVVRAPTDNVDDQAMLRKIQREVAQIYFAADACDGDDRGAYIRREVSAKFPS